MSFELPAAALVLVPEPTTAETLVTCPPDWIVAWFDEPNAPTVKPVVVASVPPLTVSTP